MASASTSRPTSPMGGPRPRSTDPEDFVVVDPNESYASSSVVLLDDRSALVTSWAMSPFLLGSIRLLAGTYALLTVCVNLGFNVSLRRTGDSYFSYFTNLSLIGLVAYLIAAAVQTLCYWKRTREGRSGYPLVDKWPRPFLVLHMVLMSTIATFPIIVTIVFWSLLSTPAVLGTPYLAWSNVSQHILNTVYALFEIFMTNIPPLPWLHLVVCVVLLACYLGVAYVTYATQGFYTYEFLDPSEGPILAAYIVGIAVGEVIVFVIVRYVIALREKLVNRRAATADVSETEKEGNA